MRTAARPRTSLHVDRATFLVLDAAFAPDAHDAWSREARALLREQLLQQWRAAGSPRSITSAVPSTAQPTDERRPPARKRRANPWHNWWAGYAARQRAIDVASTVSGRIAVPLVLPPSAVGGEPLTVLVWVYSDPSRADALAPSQWGNRMAASLVKWQTRGLLRAAPTRARPARARVCHAWSRRIVALAHGYQAAQHANAFISTMGGGYFMCKKIKEARKMALLQAKLAAWTGERDVLSSTAIHLIYNSIALGRFDEAGAMIAQQVASLEAHGSLSKKQGVHAGMLRAAKVYLAELRKLQASNPALLSSAAEVPEHDELYRQRSAMPLDAAE